MTHSRSRTRSAALVAVFAGMAFFGQLSGIAQAVPPTAEFMNPDETVPGPSAIISDEADGTDGAYHFVVRAQDPDNVSPGSGNGITSVQIQIDTDGNGSFETIPDPNATRVGTTDAWELKWDIPAGIQPVGGQAVRALITDAAAETFIAGPEAGAIDGNPTGGQPNTVEITSPANGAQLGFFGGAAQISGTASDGIPAGTTVDLYFTADAALNNETVYAAKCGEGTVTDPAGPGNSTWTGSCAAGAPATVTGVAARADNLDEDAFDADESGDAHRVFGYVQTPSTTQITPSSDTGTTGFCNTFTVTVRDSENNNPIVGINADVHAQGPDDNIQFAVNNDDTTVAAGATLNDPDSISDDHNSPTLGGHAAGKSAECDDGTPNNGARDTDADNAADDHDGDAFTATAAALGTTGEEGVHVDPGNDIKHIEGTTDANGFQFSIESAVNGTTNLTAWGDTDNSDTQNAGDATQATATKTWGAPTPTILDATPEEDVNTLTTGTDNHTITIRVTDQNGNPQGGVVVRALITAGPHADNDVGPPGGPNGYIGQATTDITGTATLTYEGIEAGTDTIITWTNVPEDNKQTGPDGNDPNDEVKKTWVQQPPNACIDFDPNFDTNSANTTHLMTAFVTNGGATPATSFSTAGDNADAAGQVDNDCAGALLQGVAVTFQIDDDSPDAGLTPDNNTAMGGADTGGNDADGGREDSETVLTNASGVATITLDNLTDAPGDGRNLVDATLQSVPGTVGSRTTPNPSEAANTDEGATPGEGEQVPKDWVVAGAAVTLECAPNNDLNAVGDTTSYTATLLDNDANPVAGQPIDMEVTAGPHAGSDLDGNAASPVGHFVDQALTNASGQVTGSYTGTAAGTDTLDCYVDTDNSDAHNGGEIRDLPALSDTRQWVAAADIQAADVELDKDPLDQDAGDPGSEPGTAFTANNPGFFAQDSCNAPVGSFATQGNGSFGVGPDWDNASTHPVNSVHLLCVSAEFTSGPTPGAQLTGAEVTVTATGVGGVTTDPTGAGAGSSATSRIDIDPAGSAGGADGPGNYAEFFVVSEDIGTMGVTATVDGVTDTDSGTNTFIVSVGEEREVDCDPDTDTNEPGTDHEILCTVTDGLDNPVAGAPIAWTKTESGGATSTFQFQQVVTDVNGNARASINSPTEGTTQVTATIGGECAAAAGAPHTGATIPPIFPGGSWDTGKPAGDCSDTVSSIWKKTVVPPPPPQSCPQAGGYNKLVGSKGDDKLKGGRDCDKIRGKKGDDKLKGRGEDDLLVGGPGFDKCVGGPGKDLFRGCEKIKKGSQAEVV